MSWSVDDYIDALSNSDPVGATERSKEWYREAVGAVIAEVRRLRALTGHGQVTGDHGSLESDKRWFLDKDPNDYVNVDTYERGKRLAVALTLAQGKIAEMDKTSRDYAKWYEDKIRELEAKLLEEQHHAAKTFDLFMDTNKAKKALEYWRVQDQAQLKDWKERESKAVTDLEAIQAIIKKAGVHMIRDGTLYPASALEALVDMDKKLEEAEARALEHFNTKESLYKEWKKSEALLEATKSQLAEMTKDRDDWKRDSNMFSKAWARELGDPIRNKTHLIDALVVTTRDRMESLKKVQAEAKQHFEGVMHLGPWVASLHNEIQRMRRSVSMVANRMENEANEETPAVKDLREAIAACVCRDFQTCSMCQRSAPVDLTKSQVRVNAEKDPKYVPYCLRCNGLVRMKKVEDFYWRCACGAEHDERDPCVVLGTGPDLCEACSKLNTHHQSKETK